MKLKLNATGGVEVIDGKPVYITEDGKEVAFDAPATVATIGRLNAESKTHREGKEAAELKLRSYEGIADPEAARKALKTVENLDHKKLVDAGEVEKVKEAAIKSVEEKYAPIVTQRDQLQAAFHGELVGGRFARSKFIGEKMVLPPDFVQARFGQHFKIEDGNKVVAYDGAGSKIFSRARPGEVADFDEALQIIVEAHPSKDAILKATSKSGGGSPPNGSGGGGAQKTMKRAEFEVLHPQARLDAVKAGTQIVD